ncbi:MAG TPA: DNA-3-methyladenine glycosylase [Terriglobales bacterium]|nr:DNA-3-methyladenine glycosylase [Terriglobales bacterium]
MTIFPIDPAALAHLSKKDKRMAAFIAQCEPIEREVHDDVFEALVSSIVSQQVSGAAARTVWGRLEAACGGSREAAGCVAREAASADRAATGCIVTPERVSGLALEELRSFGMSGRKSEYVSGVAGAVMSGALDLEGLKHEPDAVIVERLSALRGVGVWTAEMLLIFAFLRPDVLSWGDLAIRRGIMELYGLRTLTKEQFERYRRRYSPYGTTASFYLWRASHGIGIA